MKISNYTFFVEYESNSYLYNTLSNSLVQIDKETYQLLQNYKNKHTSINKEEFESELYQLLVNKRFICETDKDELLLYRSMVQPIREQRKFMHLTIAPTTDCCFKCFYCFEHNKRRGYMSSSVMDSIIKYISKQPELERLALTWFGGEPLMAQKEMREFYRKLRTIFTGTIESNIITTGYHICPETIEMFQELGITSIQITLDGHQDSHNKIKFIDECSNVFSKTINNVRLLTTMLPDIHVVFRVNITKENANEYVSLFWYIHNEFKGRNISISPAMVKNRQLLEERIATTKDVYFTNKEFSHYIVDLFLKHKIHSPFLRYPDDQMCECAIRDRMAIAFDPEGYAYKCWEKIGDSKYSIGKIDVEGNLVDVNVRELNRELYGADPFHSSSCSKCKILPICHGGCPIERIQNEYEGYCNETCAFQKYAMEDYIKAHLMLKDIGCNNH